MSIVVGALRVRLSVGVGLAMLVGCAHPGAAPPSAPAPAACEGYDVNRAWLRAGPVYRPCEVDESAAPIQRAPTGYHPLDCKTASATLLFVVDAMGTPEPRSIKAVESTSTDFARAAIGALRQWRYRPAVKGGRKVRQVARQRFDFQCQQVPQGATTP